MLTTNGLAALPVVYGWTTPGQVNDLQRFLLPVPPMLIVLYRQQNTTIKTAFYPKCASSISIRALYKSFPCSGVGGALKHPLADTANLAMVAKRDEKRSGIKSRQKTSQSNLGMHNG
ncbi:hypothetical protein [Pseudohalocynthiibacter sp. F2068]|jgi:hypothetical protein|uniref:hypothetical protein n=1 Tax=Pseudohalocynthiibacter sp. F2068 TaxID=2926418 RepID=UPI001FF69617|nr:hypothetical protein [Pseudohalocynthiibacter sp. F2068]MCK0102901.1 hypothetical protein [Pseudohalocynthiibacter sp. F2068]